MSIAEFPDQLNVLPAHLKALITLSPSPTAVPGFLARFPQDFGRDESDTFVIWARWIPVDGGVLEATRTFLGLSPDLPSAVMEMLAGLEVGTSVWLIPYLACT